MAASGIRKGKLVPAGKDGDAVAAFLAALEHPSKDAIVALRDIVLAADARIAEGIKWNAPSFRTSDWFATFHLRAKPGVQLILHRGAKGRDDAMQAIADPDGLLQWLGPDRASVRFRDIGEVEAKRTAFEALVRQWVERMPE